MRADLALMQAHRMAGAVHLLSLMEAKCCCDFKQRETRGMNQGDKVHNIYINVAQNAL